MYEVTFTVEAEDDLSRLSKPVTQRILKKIKWLAENFETITPEPLTGEFKGLYKLRTGDYRTLYTFYKVDQKTITIQVLTPTYSTNSVGIYPSTFSLELPSFLPHTSPSCSCSSRSPSWHCPTGAATGVA